MAQLDPSQISAIIGQARDVSPSSGGAKTPKIEDTGRFKVEVTKVIAHPSARSAAMLYTVEFKVLESDNPNVRVGSIYARTRDFTDRLYGLPDVLQFVCACVGIDSTTPSGTAEFQAKRADITEAAGEAAGEDQPFAGIVLELQTQTRTSKSSGRDYTPHTWRPCSDE